MNPSTFTHRNQSERESIKRRLFGQIGVDEHCNRSEWRAIAPRGECLIDVPSSAILNDL